MEGCVSHTCPILPTAAMVPRRSEDLSGELLAPAAAELMGSLAAEATELALQLAREAAQLALELVAQGALHHVVV
jgi:hypothetical protein